MSSHANKNAVHSVNGIFSSFSRLTGVLLDSGRDNKPVLLFTDPGMGTRLNDTGIFQVTGLELDTLRLCRVVVIDTIAAATTKLGGADITAGRTTLPMAQFATEFYIFGSDSAALATALDGITNSFHSFYHLI